MMYYWLITPILLFLTFFTLCKYLWSRRHLYMLSWKLPGPPELPIIGSGYYFIGKNEDLFNVIIKILSQYTPPMKIWLGPKFITIFSDPNHIEKILSSTKITYKHELYDFLGDYVGNGLITGSGPKWKAYRKLIQPMFNLKFVSQSMEIFQNHGELFVKKLTEKVNGPKFDIIHYLHDCYGDIIAEAVMGIQLRAQHGENVDFTKATLDIYDLLFARFLKPWLHPNALYSLTIHGTMRTKIKDTLHSFAKNIIAITRAKISGNQKELHETDEDTILVSPTEQLIDIIDRNPGCMDDKDLADNILTLYAASEDTMTCVAAFTCVCLGIHKEYQDKAAEEIRMIIGETPRVLTYEEVNQLKYLDMCIKETLRLFPIAPLILRKVTEEFLLDKWLLPVGTAVMLPLFLVHRNPTMWQHPNKYYPDHFLPETVKNRHQYAFLPFSAGPRGCIGKSFAYAGMKVVMANILQRFSIEADGSIDDIPLKMDISVRSINGYNVRLKARVWD